MAVERTFYPRWDKRMLAGAAFFALLGAAFAVDLVRNGAEPRSLLVTFGALAFALVGSWLARRMSWPWSGPALRLDDDGLTIWPKRRRACYLPWADIKGMAIEESNRRYLFLPVDPSKHGMRLGPFQSPPHCPMDLWNEAGEDLAQVVTQYGIAQECEPIEGNDPRW